MGELQRLIQSHLDKYGVTRSEFARRAGTQPQTVQNWWDKPSTLPRAEHLKGVAEVVDLPYLVVLDAALADAGYRDSLTDDADTLCYRIERFAGEHPEDIAVIAAWAQAQKDAPHPPLLDDVQAATGDVLGDFIRRDLNLDRGQDGGQKLG